MFFTKDFKPTEEMTRQEMIEYLMGHYTYWTMNSWNRTTSYANNIKIYNLGLSDELMDKAWKVYNLLLNDAQFTDELEMLLYDFSVNTGYSAGFNGKSGGYLVMYYTEIRGMKNFIRPGVGIDEYEDFEDWETEDIAERVDSVKEFDLLCDDVRDLFIYYLENGEVVEVEIVKKEKQYRLAE